MAKHEGIRPIRTRPNINMLVYAEPGVGKTPFIAGSEKCLILDSDAGLDSAALAGSTAEAIEIEDHVALFDIYEWLKHEKHDFKWVWWDGITLYQEKGLEAVMADLVTQKPHRDIDLPDRGEYRTNYGRILRFVRHMSALPVNFGITAHVMYDQDFDMHVPLVAGGTKAGPMWTRVCGYMGVVAYLRQAKTKNLGKHWALHAERGYKDFYAKDRYSVIGTMRQPTVPDVEAAIRKAMPAPRKKTTTRKRRPMT